VAMTMLTFDPAGVRRVVEHMTAATDWSGRFWRHLAAAPAGRVCQRRGHQGAAYAVSIRRDDLLTGERAGRKRQE
jgi:hypothetical protein